VAIRAVQQGFPQIARKDAEEIGLKDVRRKAYKEEINY